MKAPTILLLAVLALIVIFAVANWGVIMAPTTVSLIVADIQAPLGLLLLGITVMITALFLIFVAYLQTGVLLEARRHSRELQAQRELADKAEASRFTELRNHLDTELRRIGDQVAESRTAAIARLDHVERELRTAVDQAGNTLAAYIGELEDRLERKGEDKEQYN